MEYLEHEWHFTNITKLIFIKGVCGIIILRVSSFREGFKIKFKNWDNYHLGGGGVIMGQYGSEMVPNESKMDQKSIENRWATQKIFFVRIIMRWSSKWYLNLGKSNFRHE